MRCLFRILFKYILYRTTEIADLKEIKDLLHISYNSLFIEPTKKKEVKNDLNSDYTTLFNTSCDSPSMMDRYYQVLKAIKATHETENTVTVSGRHI